MNSIKKHDKEWNLLKTESNVIIKTIDDLIDLPENIRSGFNEISKDPLKGKSLLQYNSLITELRILIVNGKVGLILD